MLKSLQILLKGMGMGLAEVIPGISGSTIALMLGIYAQFIKFLADISLLVRDIPQMIARKSSLPVLKKRIVQVDLSFGALLLSGMALSIAGGAFLVVGVLENYPHYMYAVLLGLVIGVCMLPIKVLGIPKVTDVLIVIITMLTLMALLMIGDTGAQLTDPAPLYLILVGAVAITSMVLPGVSGSFVMLVFGVYYYVVSSIKAILTFDVTISQFFDLVAFGLGVLIGFMTISRALKYALETQTRAFMAFILGLLLGSTYALVPFVSSLEIDGEFEIYRVSVSYFDSQERLIIGVIIVVVAVVSGFINYRYTKLD